MKILLLGKDGQVGWELQRSLEPLGRVVALGRHELDLEDLERVRTAVRSHAPDVIVNAAAYTAVDRAESEEARAQAINSSAVEILATAAAASGAWLVHYSTDYVFDGRQAEPYAEDDRTGPLSVYGRSKLDGENAIRASGCRHLLFRTSWVFAARGANFAKTMLRLAAERDEIRVVSDQFGAPTSAELIADVTALCLYRTACDPELAARASGTYHLAAAGLTSWHGYARFVIAEARRLGAPIRVGDDAIRAIPSTEYPLPAARPASSAMNTRKLSETFGIVLPEWTRHTRRMLAEICTQGGK